MIEQLFFELLQVAVGNRRALSVVPSAEQWAELFALSKKQSLAAVAFKGVKTLSTSTSSAQAESPFHSTSPGQVPGEGADNTFGGSLGMDEMTYLKWLGLTAKIAQRNKIVTEACEKLVKEYINEIIF